MNDKSLLFVSDPFQIIPQVTVFTVLKRRLTEIRIRKRWGRNCIFGWQVKYREKFTRVLLTLRITSLTVTLESEYFDHSLVFCLITISSNRVTYFYDPRSLLQMFSFLEDLERNLISYWIGGSLRRRVLVTCLCWTFIENCLVEFRLIVLGVVKGRVQFVCMKL